MIRVNETIKCLVCGRSDGCLVAPDGRAAICVRTPSDKVCGSAGWFHATKGPRIDSKKIRRRKRRAPINWIELLKFYRTGSVYNEYSRLGGGVYQDIQYIPMYNEDGVITGLQRIFKDRSKAFMSGSRHGLFARSFVISHSCILITEGASDTATACDLDYAVFGRSSCNTGTEILQKLLPRYPDAKVIIVADNDPPGIRGSQQLAKSLLDVGIKTGIVIPPLEKEDLSDWIARSGKLIVTSRIESVIQGTFYGQKEESKADAEPAKSQG